MFISIAKMAKEANVNYSTLYKVMHNLRKPTAKVCIPVMKYVKKNFSKDIKYVEVFNSSNKPIDNLNNLLENL